MKEKKCNICSIIGGEFKPNIETTKIKYFSLEDLPQLADAKATKEQIQMCFKGAEDQNWQVVFD